MGAWWGSGGRASGRCADKLDETLSGLGMDVVKAGATRTLDVLEGQSSPAELRAAARKLEAAVILSGTLSVTDVQELSGSDGQKDVGFDLDLELGSPDDPTGVPVAERPLRLHVVAGDEQAALLAACEQLPANVVPLVATRLRELPAIRSLLESEGKGRGVDDAVALERLRPLLDLARRHSEADKARHETEQQLLERDAKQEHGELRKHLVGDFLAEQYWVGRASGPDVLVMRLPYRLAFPEGGGERFERRPEHEQIVRGSADGRNWTPLVEVYNIFSYPSASADGASVALVIDHRQWSKALAVASMRDGAVRELVAHRSQYFSSPVISPDGQRVVFWSSLERDGDKSLEVIGADGSGRRVLVPPPWARMDQPEWLPDSRTIVLSLVEAGETLSSVWQIDVSSGERSMILRAAADPPSSFLRAAAAPDGSYLVVVEQGAAGMWLGRVDLGDRSYTRLIQAPAGRACVSPDSSRIAFETAPTTDADDAIKEDAELALVASAGGAPRLLTRNAIDDALGGWSRDGRRLYFHQNGADPDGKHRNNRIYWIEP
jgi:hypothetical protein